MARVMVIGLDGASPDLIRMGMDAGRLPAFSRFRREGIFGTLKSTYPPSSCPAWNSFSTGCNPGRIGVPYFFVRKRDTYAFQPFIFDRERHEVPFWNYVSEAGKKVGIVSVPTLYRPTPLNGFSICGFFRTIDSALTFPPELEKELEEATGVYQPEVYSKGAAISEKSAIDRIWGGASLRLGDILKTARRTVENQQKALHYLLRRNSDLDLFIAVYTILDRMQHRLLVPSAMGVRSVIMDFYALLDSCVQQLMYEAGPEVDVIIMSDHGMGPGTWAFNINDWLCKIGLLHPKTGAKPLPGRRNWLHKIHQVSLPLIESNPNFIRVVEFVKSAFGIQRLDLPGEALNADLIDWDRTKAYSFGNYGEIFLNLEGREPKGSVKPDEVEGVIGLIRGQLESLRCPYEINSLELIRGADVFRGPYQYKMADLFVKINNYDCVTNSRLFNPTLFFRKKGGSHRPEGTFMALGPSFKESTYCNQAHIMDIAPTVLQLLDIPVPEDMDGRVLADLLRGHSAVSYQRASGIGLDEDEYSEKDEKILYDRLRSLGYL
jgi:predicted AlkP superfamily phosphohydrolase/phosphomutase